MLYLGCLAISKPVTLKQIKQNKSPKQTHKLKILKWDKAVSQARLFPKCSTALVSHKQCSSYSSELEESNFSHIFAATGSPGMSCSCKSSVFTMKILHHFSQIALHSLSYLQTALSRWCWQLHPRCAQICTSSVCPAQCESVAESEKGPEGLCALPAAPVCVVVMAHRCQLKHPKCPFTWWSIPYSSLWDALMKMKAHVYQPPGSSTTNFTPEFTNMG